MIDAEMAAQMADNGTTDGPLTTGAGAAFGPRSAPALAQTSEAADMPDAEWYQMARGKVEALLDALGAQLDAEPVYRRDEFGRSYTVAVPVLRRQRPERGL